MKKFIQTIKNIFKIEELRKRIGYTLLLILVYRLGSFIVLPGIDASQLAKMQDFAQERVSSAFLICSQAVRSVMPLSLRWV